MIRLLGTLPSRGWNTLKFPLNYLRRDNVLRCDLARGRYLDYKYKMEFDEAQLTELFAFAKTIDLQFFASVWDKDSCDVMTKSARRRDHQIFKFCR